MPRHFEPRNNVPRRFSSVDTGELLAGLYLYRRIFCNIVLRGNITVHFDMDVAMDEQNNTQEKARGEGILPLFSAVGKMPTGRKAGTASPQCFMLHLAFYQVKRFAAGID